MKARNSMSKVRRFADVVGLAVAILVVIKLFSASNDVLMLYGRWDVVVVTFAAVSTLACVIPRSFCVRTIWHASFVILALIMIAGCLVLLASSVHVLGNDSLPAMTMLRCSFAFVVMMAVFVLNDVFFRQESFGWFRDNAVSANVLFLVVAIAIPATYVDTLSEGFHNDLEQALDSNRYAIAYRYSAILTQLNPRGMVRGESLHVIANQLGKMVGDFEAAVRDPIPRNASIAERRNRVTLLMHLDRNRQALVELQSFTQGPQFQPISLDYCGLCFQRLEMYSQSLAAYQASVSYWKTQDEGNRRKAGLVSGWKGIGYAARRLNQRRLEENAYQELVHVSPSAAHHLLLAQCYRDHQKTSLAAEHYAITSELDPGLMSQSQAMLSNMSRDHFGCWNVPRH